MEPRADVEQWLCSATHDTQQRISLIGFLSLKLPLPPCAVHTGTLGFPRLFANYVRQVTHRLAEKYATGQHIRVVLAFDPPSADRS